MKVIKLSDEQKELLELIDSKMGPIQSELDQLNAEFQEAMKVVEMVKDKIRPLKAKLGPLGSMKATVVKAKDQDYYAFAKDKLSKM